MKIGGLQRVSLIEYPGKIGAVVFTQGCNFRCAYCHNPELVDPDRYGPVIPEEEVLAFLDKRRGKLEAVTVTGGEPTLQPDLESFLQACRNRGYLIKLDTNGSNPDALERVIRKRLADYLAMDVKGPLGRYRQIASVKVDTSRIEASIALVATAGIPYEFRTTVVRSQLDLDDLISVATLVRHARRYVLQPFVPGKTLAGSAPSANAYTPGELSTMGDRLRQTCPGVIVR
ncbi:MAG: anaerobic ribonucleoside-triphosphate reductase activating protein [Thermodesulfobacteriota bacterium]